MADMLPNKSYGTLYVEVSKGKFVEVLAPTGAVKTITVSGDGEFARTDPVQMEASSYVGKAIRVCVVEADKDIGVMANGVDVVNSGPGRSNMDEGKCSGCADQVVRNSSEEKTTPVGGALIMGMRVNRW